jgi:PleD family two-component response regulator
MLIPGDDVEDAFRVVERLRAAMPLGQTCSAGIALRSAGESLEHVVGRADQALYQAKTTGRDRSCVEAFEAPRSPSAI